MLINWQTAMMMKITKAQAEDEPCQLIIELPVPADKERPNNAENS